MQLKFFGVIALFLFFGLASAESVSYSVSTSNDWSSQQSSSSNINIGSSIVLTGSETKAANGILKYDAPADGSWQTFGSQQTFSTSDYSKIRYIWVLASGGSDYAEARLYDHTGSQVLSSIRFYAASHENTLKADISDVGGSRDVSMQLYDRDSTVDIDIVGPTDQDGDSYYDSSSWYLFSYDSSGSYETVWKDMPYDVGTDFSSIDIGVSDVDGVAEVKVLVSDDGSTVKDSTSWMSISSTGTITKDISGLSKAKYVKVRFSFDRDANNGGSPRIGSFKVEGTANPPPNSPSNPDPNDGSTGRSTNPVISAKYTEPEGESGTLTFYDEGGNQIGSCSVSDGNGCGVTHSGADSRGTTYYWYAVASDNDGSTQSSTWSFTTDPNGAPSASNFDPGDGSSGVSTSPTISADYSDPEGDSGTVYFYDGSGSLIGSQNVNNGDTASVTYSGAGSECTTYDWYVSVEDDYDGSSYTSSTKSFTTTGCSILESTSNSNTVQGALWVQSSDLRWGDGSTEYWLKDANIVTSSASGPNGALWVQGTTIRWIDQNGNERSYEGPVVASSVGGPSGALWFQNGYIHYIDQNGDERVTDGT